MTNRVRFGVVALVSVLAACGSSSDEAGDETSPSAGESSGGGPASSSGGSAVDTELAGVWEVTGADDRGGYHGHVELIPDGRAYRFTRVIRYDDVRVEDGRELHWVWDGRATGTRASVSIEVSLARRGFVSKRGAFERKPQDGPITVKATFANLTGSWAGDGIVQKTPEKWSGRVASGAVPIFGGTSRTIVPAHDPPSPTRKQQYDSAFASFRDLPNVKPYTTKPEFIAAIHGWVTDTTDFDFYRANPNALRVVDRVIDPISLAETLMRANAYRFTLEEKASRFEQDFVSKFMDASVGMVVDGGPPGGPFAPSGDSALWTGTYVAALGWQYEVTGDANVLARMKTSLDAMLKLQEITGDWGQFARSLRKATGNATSPWHAGTGAYADLDWLEGGNNDMFKGLVYAQLMGWRLLCKTHRSDAESLALCARIETNAKHLADDVRVDRGLNQVPSYWLASIVTGDVSYELKANAYWSAGKIEQQNNPVRYDDGIADWSGINLTFTGDLILALLAAEKDLGGDAVTTMRDSIDQNHAVLARQRMLVWHLLHATHGTGAKASSFIDDMRWRLREIPWPKRAFGEIDHTLEDGFCLSPYPNVPWKNDWTTTDRTNTLNQFPIFELPVDINYFKAPPEYRGPADYESPGVDYLHAYWLARRYGLLAAGD